MAPSSGGRALHRRSRRPRPDRVRSLVVELSAVVSLFSLFSLFSGNAAQGQALPQRPAETGRAPYGLPVPSGISPEARTSGTPPCSADLPAGSICVWPGPSGYLVAPYEAPSPKYFSRGSTRDTRPYAIFLGNDGRDFRMVGSSIVLYSIPTGTRCDPTPAFVLETANDFYIRDCEEGGKTP